MNYCHVVSDERRNGCNDDGKPGLESGPACKGERLGPGGKDIRECPGTQQALISRKNGDNKKRGWFSRPLATADNLNAMAALAAFSPLRKSRAHRLLN